MGLMLEYRKYRGVGGLYTTENNSIDHRLWYYEKFKL